MLISHKHKFVTIDIPKTGSRSLRETLLPLKVIDIHGEPSFHAQFYQHDHSVNVKKQFAVNQWNWNDYYKFTIVRNPWTRYYSFYKYYKRYAEQYISRCKSIIWTEPELNQGKLCAELFKNKNDQQVLKNIILNNDPQDLYYCDESSEIAVDHIAEFENLSNEFVFLCNRVGIEVPSLQHCNKSVPSQNMHDVYNQQLIDLVSDRERHVIELKDYKFNVNIQ